ncbi:hypothetical protein [Mycolicibacterium canariasense]|nr:hypothetical protein [Mycolicibacterium canariasense]MCV7208844.1 hypothetical protein [Mycolicibacterium canariasense]
MGIEMVTGASMTLKYGPASFVAALANILLVNLCIWLFVLGMFGGYQYYLPLLTLDLVISYVLTLRRGTYAQVGRGMLIGWLSAPLSLVIFIGVFSIGKAIGI